MSSWYAILVAEISTNYGASLNKKGGEQQTTINQSTIITMIEGNPCRSVHET